MIWLGLADIVEGVLRLRVLALQLSRRVLHLLRNFVMHFDDFLDHLSVLLFDALELMLVALDPVVDLFKFSQKLKCARLSALQYSRTKPVAALADSLLGTSVVVSVQSGGVYFRRFMIMGPAGKLSGLFSGLLWNWLWVYWLLWLGCVFFWLLCCLFFAVLYHYLLLSCLFFGLLYLPFEHVERFVDNRVQVHIAH